MHDHLILPRYCLVSKVGLRKLILFSNAIRFVGVKRVASGDQFSCGYPSVVVSDTERKEANLHSRDYYHSNVQVFFSNLLFNNNYFSRYDGYNKKCLFFNISLISDVQQLVAARPIGDVF